MGIFGNAFNLGQGVFQAGQQAYQPQQGGGYGIMQPMQQPRKLDRYIDAAQGVGAALRDDPQMFDNFQNRQAIMQQRGLEHQQSLEDYQRRMADEQATWIGRAQWERDNPKPQQAPAFVRNLQAWQQMPPQMRQQVAQMQSVLNPGYFTGADGQRYPNAPAQVQAAPWHDNPDDWEMVPDEGGAGSSAPRGFPIPSGNPLRPYP